MWRPVGFLHFGGGTLQVVCWKPWGSYCRLDGGLVGWFVCQMWHVRFGVVCAVRGFVLICPPFTAVGVTVVEGPTPETQVSSSVPLDD